MPLSLNQVLDICQADTENVCKYLVEDANDLNMFHCAKLSRFAKEIDLDDSYKSNCGNCAGFPIMKFKIMGYDCS